MRGVDAAGLLSAYSPVASATTPETSPIGAITGERSTPTGTVSLTGATDWAHWGLLSSSTVTRKAGIAPIIGGVTIVGGDPASSYGDHPLTFTWSDGAPTPTASTTTGIYVEGAGNGFRLTVPADTVRRRLTLYAGVWRAQGRLVASLSDGAAPDYVDTGLNNSIGPTPARYSIEYQAAAANQSLTVTFTQAGPSDGNVTLQAATLVEAVPDFAISASPSALTAEPGEAVSYAIAVSRLNGFAGSVGLDLSGLPPGATATFTPSTVTGSDSTSTLTVTTAAGTTSSSWPLTITGTAGTLTRTATATLDVVTSDFTLTAAPASQTIGPGSAASYTVTVAPLAGFSGSIALSASGLPAGASAVFEPAIIAGGSGSATLTVATTAATPASISSLTVTGVSDALTHSTSVSLAVETPDYLVFAGPSSRTVAPGESTTYNISTAASGGFAGTVALTVEGLPAGATATFSPATIAAGAGTSTLTVTLPSAVAAGETTFTIQGASGPLVRNAFVTLSVSAASLTGAFAVPTGAQSLPALGTSDWAHWGVSAATSYTHRAAVTPLISNVTLVGGGSAQRYTNNPVGFSWIDGTPDGRRDEHDHRHLRRRGQPRLPPDRTGGYDAAHPHPVRRRLAGAGPAPGAVERSVGAGLHGHVADQCDGTSVARRYTLSYQAASAGQTLTVTFTQMGTTGNVTLQAAALAAAAAAADFGLTATPATRTVTAGAETTAAIATAPINGFSGNVALSVTGLPAGATASFAPVSISGGSGASTLTVATTAGTPAGTFPLPSPAPAAP